jgi:Response regulator of the LytR/AlgR family
MKVQIEQSDKQNELEIVIKCREVTDEVRDLQSKLLSIAKLKERLLFTKDNREFFLDLDKILFFESVDDTTFAHTSDDIYKIRLRLYELEDILPSNFLRISKSSIANSSSVYSITRNIGASSIVQFHDTHKQICVSRQYFKQFKNKLTERKIS